MFRLYESADDSSIFQIKHGCFLFSQIYFYLQIYTLQTSDTCLSQTNNGPFPLNYLVSNQSKLAAQKPKSTFLSPLNSFSECLWSQKMILMHNAKLPPCFILVLSLENITELWNSLKYIYFKNFPFLLHWHSILLPNFMFNFFLCYIWFISFCIIYIFITGKPRKATEMRPILWIMLKITKTYCCVFAIWYLL